MMSAAECLAKAAQMDAQADEAPSESGREAYASMARSWREMATLALEQQPWDTLAPP